MDESQIFSVVGEAGFERLVAAFYRQIPHDDLLGPMYGEEDLAGAEERLRDFLLFRFGGVPRYIEQRGHPRLRMRHVRFPIGQAARDRWMRLMTAAMQEAGFPAEAQQKLLQFFDSTATFLMNQPTE